MKQRDMFGSWGQSELTAPHCGKKTSIDAAKQIEPVAGTLRARVLEFIRQCGERGATRCEIENALGMAGNTVRPRVGELLKTGLIHETRFTRPTDSGRQATVLRSNDENATETHE